MNAHNEVFFQTNSSLIDHNKDELQEQQHMSVL